MRVMVTAVPAGVPQMREDEQRPTHHSDSDLLGSAERDERGRHHHACAQGGHRGKPVVPPFERRNKHPNGHGSRQNRENHMGFVAGK